jgi:hypothetical protein
VDVSDPSGLVAAPGNVSGEGPYLGDLIVAIIVPTFSTQMTGQQALLCLHESVDCPGQPMTFPLGGPACSFGLVRCAVMWGDPLYPVVDQFGTAVQEMSSPCSGSWAIFGHVIAGGLMAGAAGLGLGGEEDSVALIERLAQENADSGFAGLQAFMRPGEVRAYLADPAMGSRFLGQAVHRAVAAALNERFGGAWVYSTRGVDFTNTVTGDMVELTTTGQVAIHVAKGGDYVTARYALYALP